MGAGVPEPETFPWEQPLGAHPIDADTTRFRVWAPRPERVTVRLGASDHPLADDGHGVLSADLPAGHGDDYWFVADGRELPDPSSRWQPDGIRGRSRVVDPARFDWTDAGWRTPPLADMVIYELHVGTFTPEGTFDAAIGHLRGLRELGVNAIELMPVAEFPGRHGWGYDGVHISAAQSSYGGPEGLQRLVDAAHGEGIAVLLDVVYNHLGASGGGAMEAFGPYFTEKYSTFWGAAINYDDADSDPVREWVLQSAMGWIRDFHIDGLRLDAIHAIFDSNPEHLVAALARRVHAVNPEAVVIAESGLNDPKVMRPAERGGYGCDAAWADDFHHALRVLLTGDREGYYAEFGEVAQLAKAFHRPHVHDGVFSTFRRRRFGAPADDVAPEAFVVFSANHDQVGNRAFGDRLPVEVRPLAALVTLLSPFTPMIFQGEEYGETAPFQFFSDHIDEDIATATREGRRREFAAFAQFGEEVPDPQDPATFQASKLTRRGEPAGIEDLHRRLLAVRRELPAGEAGDVAFDESARTLRVRRGDAELVCNFGAAPLRAAGEVVVAAGDVRAESDGVVIGALSGALVR
jgi:maltooligosyltrehalose trehalohydrolase